MGYYSLFTKKQINDFSKCTYKPVGRCIYCGSEKNLEKEHIIPYALGSDVILPKSTCRKCAKITGSFEQIVLRGPMWGVRKILKLKSRSKHIYAPKTERLTILKDGVKREIKIPLEEYPFILYFPIFTKPGYAMKNYSRGIDVIGVDHINFGQDPKIIAKKYNADKLIYDRDIYCYTEFAQTIAKIGYSYAVAEGHIKKVKSQPLLLSSLLGKSNDIGRYVGTSHKHELYQGLRHRLAVYEDKKKGLLIAEVQLFADSQTPIYEVIIGHLD